MTSEVERLSHRSTFPALSSCLWWWLRIGQHRFPSPQEVLLATQIMYYKTQLRI